MKRILAPVLFATFSGAERTGYASAKLIFKNSCYWGFNKAIIAPVLTTAEKKNSF